MIVDGGGMIARAFLGRADPARRGLIFARGVARSDETRAEEFDRELEALDGAIDRSNDIGEPLVYFSGAPIYGTFNRLVSETDPLRPLTPYGRHQAECEDLVRRRAEGFLILRLPNAVGATTNTHQLIPSLVSQMASGSVQIQTNAERDLIDVEDVVTAALSLLATGRHADTFNVASGQCIPIPTIVDELCAVLGAAPVRHDLAMGDVQRFDTSALKVALPSLEFSPGYWKEVISRYARVLAGGFVNPESIQPQIS
jgi:nucleoside-diphosphate-sugar epimerase